MINKQSFQEVKKLIKEKVAGDFVKTLSLDALAKGFTFIFLPLYTRVMSEEEFGLFTYLYLIVTTSASIIKIGMDTAFSKLFFDYDVEKRKNLTFITNGIWISVFLFLFLTAMLFNWDTWAISLIIEKNINFASIRIQLWCFILLEILATTLSVYFLVNEKFRHFQVFNFFKIFATNFITFALLYYCMQNRVQYRLTSECIIGLLVFLPLVIQIIKNCTFEVDKEIIDKALKIGLPMVGSLLISTIYLFADRYFIQKYSGLNTLAVYNFCVMLTLPVSLFFTSFNTIWFPMFAKEKNMQVNYEKTTKITQILFAAFLFIAFLVWASLFFLLKIEIVKNTYYAALYTLPIIFLSRILDTLSNLYTNFVVILGKTTFNLLLVLFLSLLTFSLNYFFTPTYGIFAASVILLIISFLRIFTLLLFSKHHSKNLILR